MWDPQQYQQYGAGKSDGHPIDSPSKRSQRGNGSAFWNRFAATAFGERSTLAFSAGAIATPAALGFSGQGFERRSACRYSLATAAAIRSKWAGLALCGAATNPPLVRSRVILRVKLRW